MRCKKTSVCFILCFFVVFKTVLFCHDGNGPGRAQLETGWAGLGLIFLERQRAGPELNGPGRKKRARAGLY